MKLNKFTKFSVAFLSTITLGTIAWTTAASADETYTVKSGDTLSSIEYNFKHDTNYQQLAKANNIANANVIYVGQQLVIKTNNDSQTTATQSTQQTQTTQSANTQSTQSTNQSSTAYSQQNTQSTVKHQTTNTNTTSSTSTTSGSDASAKAWIANKESSGSYKARNGQYIGKYQLSSSYLNGDYSAANQEKVANSYVSSRYGSWTAAKAFWQANGWY
ncbi:LysM peptidoglycan-binding domain-containing protein [Pediococcus ethanolidurans]|uniref:aggregation-promoting factor n=1 Tax=Pediococcus ethanolidurans TaxID=319653 RepID=UPI002953AF13|nr:LysM domain-containing protein [Pediococcus ethanolidurans]MDV7719181.1 LysM peptidoglycan-binding domain-containing protein [Pediococcus ethanolidurans]